jgi:hypothetical protein
VRKDSFGGVRVFELPLRRRFLMCNILIQLSTCRHQQVRRVKLNLFFDVEISCREFRCLSSLFGYGPSIPVEEITQHED